MEDTAPAQQESTCVVCHCPARVTEQLPCDHYLCSNCIEDIRAQGAAEGAVGCPLCSNTFPSDPSLEPSSGLPRLDKPEEAAAVSDPAAELPSSGGDPKEARVLDSPSEPSTDPTERRCREHNEVLEFYCEDDGECVCGPCTITGKHKTHTLMSLEKAAAQIKGKVLNSVMPLLQTQQGYHFKYQDLQKSEDELKMQINRLRGNLSKKFLEWRKSLEEDEENVLKMIDEEGIRITAQSTTCSKTLNEKMDLIRLIDDEAQDLAQYDRLSFFQLMLNAAQAKPQRETWLMDHTIFLYSENEKMASELQNQRTPTAHNDALDIHSISEQIKALIDKSMIYYTIILNMIGEWAQLTLDTKTAYWFLTVSEDARSLTFGYDLQPYPSNPERFRTHRQILCCQSFTSGYHSWVVQAEGIAWGIGIAYGSIAREGECSDLTNSSKAWCIHLNHGTLTASHNGLHVDIIKEPVYTRFQVELDYESGYVSFYQVADTLQHLYTFRTEFTEPVFPAFSCFYISSIKLC
ncbi:E3 ubiquitin-protein ligase TRIM7-like [Carcharodon carcharias]|uniref:E3 ubiquitin-protein ligase TRIM7-like n=1 Tax=Carcharodon carcharias TaxID=13397 RepID=UPI001B7E0A77|nr:E3 ubiquitin-protein ligase TRIM7-like [Carcharodon carcharias]